MHVRLGYVELSPRSLEHPEHPLIQETGPHGQAGFLDVWEEISAISDEEVRDLQCIEFLILVLQEREEECGANEAAIVLSSLAVTRKTRRNQTSPMKRWP